MVNFGGLFFNKIQTSKYLTPYVEKMNSNNFKKDRLDLEHCKYFIVFVYHIIENAGFIIETDYF